MTTRRQVIEDLLQEMENGVDHEVEVDRLILDLEHTSGRHQSAYRRRLADLLCSPIFDYPSRGK